MTQNKNKEKEEAGEECVSNRGRTLEIHEGSETLPGRARCTVREESRTQPHLHSSLAGTGKPNSPPKRNPSEIGHPWP